jgi:hypothetical protein
MKIKSTLKLTALALLAVLTLNSQLSTAFAQGTVITYQGQLQNNGSPANGSYTIIFNLYTNATGGNALGAETNSNVAVNNGLFTTTIDGSRLIGDFGGGPLPWPSPSWLELAVATNGANTFITLTPRQQLTSVPVAIYAETAGLSGAYGNALTLYNPSNSFCGNGACLIDVNAYTLDGFSASNFWKTIGNAGTTPGLNYLGTTDGQPLEILAGGGVGIGKPNPATALDVNGIVSATGLDLPSTQVRPDIINSGPSYLLYADNNGNFFSGQQAGASTTMSTSGTNNTGGGVSALANNTSGTANTAYGFNALFDNQSGSYNTANGSQALYANTSGSNNTASGYQALYSNTTGADNTANGNQALYSNTTGGGNTANGYNALEQNESGGINTAIGVLAMADNKAGNDNTAVGGYALTSNNGYANTAIGGSALGVNYSGSDNTAIGFQALYLNSTGGYNIALGYQAGINITGSSNIDIGNPGVAAENGTIRIGVEGSQNSAYVAGVYGTPLASGSLVVVDSSGQLGTESTLPSGSLSGTYSSAVTFNNGSDSFSGNGAGLTGVNAAMVGGLGAANFWQTTGNAGTTPGLNYLGTTDGKPLEILAGGGVGIGTASPSQALTVVGNASFTGALYLPATGVRTDIIYSGNQLLLYGDNQTNFFVGQLAGNTAQFGFVTGEGNSGSGVGALYSITSGSQNTADGAHTLDVNTNGSANTALGFAALSSNTSGNNNTALGSQAGLNITTGSLNIDIGNAGLSTDANIIRIGTQGTQTSAYVAGIYGTPLASGSLVVVNSSGQLGTEATLPPSSLSGTYTSAVTFNNSGNSFTGNGAGLANVSAVSLSTGAALGAGSGNTISSSGATDAFLGGGEGNSIGASSVYAAIDGGQNNIIEANAGWSVIAGGEGNTTYSGWSVISGGNGNWIGSGTSGSTIGGGWFNTNTANYATVPGGYENAASGAYSFAAGDQAQAVNQGAFVWADAQGGGFASTANNQVSFRCGGGVRFTSGSAGTDQTVSWAPGGGAWTFSSDRNLKDRLENVDPESVLEKVSQLPILEWSYKGYPQRHIGAMAQDFHDLFPLNDNDKALNDLDLHGVTLAAIQGLNRKVEEKEARIQEQNSRIQNQSAEITELKARLDRLEHAISGK